VDVRDVSLRWLAGVVLTMVTGSGLIGAAAYASLDRRSGPPEAPQFAAAPKREPTEPGAGLRKGDRLVKSVDMIAAKQTFRTPVAMRSGDKEVIRQRAFTRVVTPLTLASVGFADEVPEFNPMRLMGEGGGPAVAESDPGPAGEDSDVSFQTIDLARVDANAGPTLSADEAASQIDEHVKNLIAAGSRPPLPIPSQLLLMRTSRVGADPHGALSYARPETTITAPFSSIEVRMVPENVTQIPKASTLGQSSQIEQRLVVLRRGETLDDILIANGATKEQAKSVATAMTTRRGEAPAQEGQKLMLTLADLDGAGKTMTIVRVSLYTDEKLEVTVAALDAGGYVQIDRAAAGPAAKPKPRRKGDEDDDEEDDSGGMRLHASLYETALKQEIPRPLIDELVRIFSNDVDFQRSVAGGDSIDVFYGENEENENKNELLYASITTRDETFRYYRYLTPDDNTVDFYDENGRSTGKFLIRKPVAAGELRSGFGMRYHPILHYARPHTGVDWSGPIGTPIYAAGNGVVLKASWDSGGYGRRVEIQHANGYVSTYNHMSGFAKGVVEGVRVRQGQVIGYLGSTGLSTGPHLHYEIMVNGHFVDPMRIRVSRQKEFDGRALAEFKRERDRIDQLMAKAPNATPQRVAQRK
jgi:murein DD-endopeptidase MepM/ murein hydrolase activator NlpD